MLFVLCAIYNLAILAGTAYLVTKHGWSGWWFVLAVMLMAKVTPISE